MELSSLKFDNNFVQNLPGDPENKNNCRQVYNACYSKVFPTSVKNPYLIACSQEAAKLLDLEEGSCKTDLFCSVFSGKKTLPGMIPFAMCYGGHQFGSWAGQLGDGRAINLGEIINSNGHRWMLQLKGAGPTPYSRRADGLAVLRSSIREFLCSEAMHHLGIPTTRALSLVGTGEKVMRDMFYDGHPRLEPGAVICRLSPSFTRFGNFEIFAARNDINTLKKLVDYTIATDFPDIGKSKKYTYLEWFSQICKKTTEMIVHWMRVGFVHGVMNTDNMSILGLTIDYGPYGWLEGYEPGWTPNTTDSEGKRYAFGNQPNIGLWNLTQLANSLLPLINEPEEFQKILSNSYWQPFVQGWQKMMAAKLGLKNFKKRYDQTLIADLLDILTITETDMTIFFRQLALLNPALIIERTNSIPEILTPAYYKPEEINDDYISRLSRWLTAYGHRIQKDENDSKSRIRLMNKTNPKYVLRNYLAQQAIEKAESGDYKMIYELFSMIKKPYEEQTKYKKYYARRPEWARHKPGSATLS